MTIDPQTGLVTSTWPMSIFSAYHKGPFSFPCTVNVKDGNGVYTTQTINMTLSCPTGQDWVWDGNTGKGECQANSVGATISSQPTIQGLSAGSTYTYQVKATDANNDSLTFSLTAQPAGMLNGVHDLLLLYQKSVYIFQ